MHRSIIILCAVALAFPLLSADEPSSDFERERKGSAEQNAAKDAVEGKAPPALAVKDWLNTDGKALDWVALRGKVVVIDFWGTW